MSTWSSIEPEAFLARLESGDIKPEHIIDVREAMEWDYYHLEGSTHIPMNTIPDRLNELGTDHDLYIICAHGVRSQAVCRYLNEQGYESLHNVDDGMAVVALLKGFQYD